jgi:hypothetical protein
MCEGQIAIQGSDCSTDADYMTWVYGYGLTFVQSNKGGTRELSLANEMETK